MAALSATILSVSFLLASLIGVAGDAPGWFSGITLVIAVLTALMVISAIASDTQTARRQMPSRQTPSSN